MTGGMIYFPRMLDKIRLHARGELRLPHMVFSIPSQMILAAMHT